MLGAAWYGQGLRLLDIGNARDVRQVGYYRVTGTDAATNPSSNSWDVAFKTNRLVYLFDMDRGIEVLRLKQGASAARKMRGVTAPSVKSDRLAAKPAVSLDGDRSGTSYVCPLFL
jgi:hypothetical protein